MSKIDDKKAQTTSTQPYYTDSKGRKFTAQDILFKGFKPAGKFKKGPQKGASHSGASVAELLGFKS